MPKNLNDLLQLFLESHQECTAFYRTTIINFTTGGIMKESAITSRAPVVCLWVSGLAGHCSLPGFEFVCGLCIKAPSSFPASAIFARGSGCGVTIV